jgi:hypothetical protein
MSAASFQRHSGSSAHPTQHPTNQTNQTKQVGGYWSNGKPYLDVSAKATPAPWDAGLQLPLMHLDVSAAKAHLLGLPEAVWSHEYQAAHSAVMGGRDTNMNAFKPGVRGITLLFSAGSGEGPVFEFPLYKEFAPVLEPLLEEVRGAGWSVGWLVGWWVGWLGGWVVCWLVGFGSVNAKEVAYSRSSDTPHPPPPPVR